MAARSWKEKGSQASPGLEGLEHLEDRITIEDELSLTTLAALAGAGCDANVTVQVGGTSALTDLRGLEGLAACATWSTFRVGRCQTR